MKLQKSLIYLILFAMHSTAGATVVNTLGSVTSLTDVSQITKSILGFADFEDGVNNNVVAADTYSTQGMNFLEGSFSAGTAVLPRYSNTFASSFTGVDIGEMVNYFGGVAIFDSSLHVTQFGLDASSNGIQHLTAFDTSGNMIGQASWDGRNAGFIGIDSLGVAIGMIAFGNDDLFNGNLYTIAGATNISDNWIWAGDASPSTVPVPAAAWLFGSALLGFYGYSRRKVKA